MSIRRTNLLYALLLFGVLESQCQSNRRQQIQEPVFQRAIPGKQLRFISQPITTKPTQFFQPQQQRFRQQSTQRFQQNVPLQQETPVNQQQNFFDQNANNFNTQEQQPVQQTTQQFNEQFQGTPQEERNIQQAQTFERLPPQNQQRLRPHTQPISVRRPVNRQPTTTFVATQTNRRPLDTPESIIRSLTNVDDTIQGVQDTPVHQNTGFTQPEEPEFNVPVQRPAVRQRRPKPTIEDEEAVREQALNAKYSFSSEVNDGINDHNHIRAETRDGLKLSGVYSYSDGYFKRTVHYEADENGYRIVKEDNEPIGNGPNTDLGGTADVAANVGGANIQYSIRAEEVPGQLFTDRNLRREN